jgi:ABC-type branched-subunit amino acid transport system substrate-binding protein
MFAAAKTYVEWHNRFREPKIRLEVASYLRSPVAALLELQRRGAVAVLGFTTSDTGLDAASAAERLKLPVISVSATTSFLAGKEDWFFRVQPSTRADSSAYSRLFRFRNIGTLAVVAIEDNAPYVLSLVRDLYVKGSPRILGPFRLSEIQRADDALASLDPDGILVVGPTSFSIWASQRATKLWPRAELFLSLWSVTGLGLSDYALLGKPFFFSSVFSPVSLSEAHPFIAAWREEYTADVTFTVDRTFLALELFRLAVEDVKRGNAPSLRDALAMPRHIEGPGGNVIMDRYGDAHGQPYFFRWDGRRLQGVSVP